MLCSPLAGSATGDVELGPWPVYTAAPAPARGRLLILPGVRNTKFHLSAFVRAASLMLPGFEIEVMPWGAPLLGLHNLRAYERNVQTAQTVAAELAEWRNNHPDEFLYVVGYSGGGGMAALIVDALPDGMAVDRLVLVAPAISQTFPVEERLLPHVKQFIVNYASERDLQVGLGTTLFGTIDRVNAASAGHDGFSEKSSRLLEWHWSTADKRVGHRGNHVAYLGRRWQMSSLLPAVDPAADTVHIEAAWQLARERDVE